jgi:hypothetical protein
MLTSCSADLFEEQAARSGVTASEAARAKTVSALR